MGNLERGRLTILLVISWNSQKGNFDGGRLIIKLAKLPLKWSIFPLPNFPSGPRITTQ